MRKSLFVAVLTLAAVALDLPAQAVAERPTITVTDFDYGTVATQLTSDRGTRRRMERMGIRDANAFVAALGTGVADMIVQKLVERGEFRVLERKQMAAVQAEQTAIPQADTAIPTPAMPRARYIVSGSISRLGFEEKHFGGIAGRFTSSIGGLGANKNTTEVAVTARVIDTRTGEIVASWTGEGVSSKGWGLKLGWFGTAGFGGFDVGSRDFKESAIGEATERAVTNIVDRLSGDRARLAAVTAP